MPTCLHKIFGTLFNGVLLALGQSFIILGSTAKNINVAKFASLKENSHV